MEADPTEEDDPGKDVSEGIIIDGIIVVDYTSAIDNNPAIVTIANTPGVALPNTGGPGTKIFTILGSILILGAGVLLWRRKRLI